MTRRDYKVGALSLPSLLWFTVVLKPSDTVLIFRPRMTHRMTHEMAASAC
jgi:hypothetical protein